jgi:hypothetical protein
VSESLGPRFFSANATDGRKPHLLISRSTLEPSGSNPLSQPVESAHQGTPERWNAARSGSAANRGVRSRERNSLQWEAGRAGDPATLVADPSRAEHVLGVIRLQCVFEEELGNSIRVHRLPGRFRRFPEMQGPHNLPCRNPPPGFPQQRIKSVTRVLVSRKSSSIHPYFRGYF